MILSAVLFSGALTLTSNCKPTPSPVLGVPVSAFSTYVRTMMQDDKNVYWFGSDANGVYRYDGKTLINYTTKDGLPSNQVTEIQQDKTGNLFFGTSEGLCKFDGRSFKILTPVIMKSPDEGWRLDPKDLWFARGSREGGPSRYDGKTLYYLKFPKHHLEDAKRAKHPDTPASMYAVYTIYKDKKGNIWFGTGDAGLCRYDGKTINWLYEDHLTDAPNGGSFGIRSIIEDRDGKFWICNTQYRFNVSEKNLPTHGLLNYKSEPGTGNLTRMIGEKDLYYQSIVQGKEGDLWMMPWGGGIFRYDGVKITHYPVKHGSEDALMNAMYKDRQGNLWICSQTGGPYKFNGKSFEKFKP